MSARSKRMHAEITERLCNDPGLPHPNPTSSYWQEPVLESVAALQSPQLDETTDILVIGSGITGCSVARHLLDGDSNLKVTVVEARTICSGATGRNGGHVKAVPEYSFAELVPSLGKEEADAVIRFTLANPDALLQVKDTLSPELQKYCEVRRVESLNLFTDDGAVSQFESLLEDFERSHPKRGRIVPKDELEQKFDVHNAAGAYLAPAGAGWPYRLITGLFANMVTDYKDRFRLEALTPVQSIKFLEASQTYRVTTPRGSIHAKQVVHATNGHAGHLLPGIRGKLYPVRGQMTAQSPSSRFGIQGATRSWSIHYGTGFDYMTQSGTSGEIFLGGGLGQAYLHGLDELGNVRDDVNSVLATAHLSGIINAIWCKDKSDRATVDVRAAWTGIMGFTTDGLPMVGKLAQEATLRSGSGEWIAGGYNGYGMANAWLSGKYVADRILGKEDDGLLPQSYKYSAARLKSMQAGDGATHWMTALGLD